MTEWADRVERELEDAVDPERKKHAARYFASELEVMGVAVPHIRRIARHTRRDTDQMPPERILALALELVGRGIHEARQVAWELIGLRPDVLELLNWRTLEALGANNDNWASVDAFSVLVSGPAWRMGRISDGRVRRWIRSSDPWWRRTALVSTVALNLASRGGSGDADRTLSVCHGLAMDSHRMVQKGLSWALRSLIQHDAERVRGFLTHYGDALPAFVRREVTVKLETGRKNPA